MKLINILILLSCIACTQTYDHSPRPSPTANRLRSGYSMVPTLYPGSWYEIVYPPFSELKIGDFVRIEQPNGRIFIHEITDQIDETHFIVWGIANIYPDETWLNPTNYHGKVIPYDINKENLK